MNEIFKTLIEKGTLSEKITSRDYPCAMNSLFDVLQGKTNKKGIVIMQTATTGLSAGNSPIQFTAIAYQITEDGLVGQSMLSIDIQADAGSLNMAIQNIHSLDGTSFDVFADTGINLEDYQKGISSSGSKVFSEEDAARTINQFFQKFSLEDYALISNGKAAFSEISSSQKSLERLGNKNLLDAPYIDFTQMATEYCYLCMKTGSNNPIIDLNKINPASFNFNLDSLARANDLGPLNHTKSKCNAMVLLIDMIDKELRKKTSTVSDSDISELIKLILEQTQAISENTRALKEQNALLKTLIESVDIYS